MEEIVFLTWDQVMLLHTMQLERHGGSDGFIDRGVVESAIAQPQQTMFGHYLHEDIAHMAAAYLFHLATTQGFVDGNKRTGLQCALTFLEINGYEIDIDSDDIALYQMAMDVATNNMDKSQLAEWFREHIKPVE